MNCIDDKCWYLKDNGCLCVDDDRYVCTKHNRPVKDPFNYEIDCEDYLEIKSCPTCKHSIMDVWESGTLDAIAYRCEEMNNAITYLDNCPLNDDYSDYPECKCSKWKKEI